MSKNKKVFPIRTLITDTHLDLGTIKENISVFEQARDISSKKGISIINHLGDPFESRKAQPLDVLDTFGQVILPLFNPVEFGVEIHFIPGNHDKVDYESEKSYLDSFYYHPGFKLTKNYGSSWIDGTDILLHEIPYFLEETTYIKYLNQAIDVVNQFPDKKHILLTHIGIDGALGNGGNKIENSLKSEEFSMFFKVFVGHYHDRNQVGDNIFYIGSTDTRIFGEDNDKGCVILYSDGSHEYHNFKFREYHTIKIDVDMSSKDEIDVLLKRYSNCKEEYIRFLFTGSKEKLNALNINKFKAVGIDVKIKRLNIEKGVVSASKEEFISFNKESIYSGFDEFSELNNLNAKQLKRCQKYLKKQLYGE